MEVFKKHFDFLNFENNIYVMQNYKIDSYFNDFVPYFRKLASGNQMGKKVNVVKD